MHEHNADAALGIMRGLVREHACVVSHPEAGGKCPEKAVGTVWHLPFCEVHFVEAEHAAKPELNDEIERGLEAFAGMVSGGRAPNRAFLGTQEGAAVPGLGSRHHSDHDEALRSAYPPIEGMLDPDTLAFDYAPEDDDPSDGDGPYDWWNDARELMVRFMREAIEQGLPSLVRDLEYLRERASAQQIQAEDDYERRWVGPRRARRERMRNSG